jgi:23S rRNA-/tRNA-specific pseudouridylate synthase
MTQEELLSRLLYRDALMLVIDKPAGFAVHGAEGRREPEDYFSALRFGLPRARAGPSASTATLPAACARTPSCRAG